MLSDFVEQAGFFFRAPAVIDSEAVKPKWSAAKKEFFLAYVAQLEMTDNWNAENLEQMFKETATEKGIKPGELQLPFRIMLVGGKFGPQVFQIADLLRKNETLARIQHALPLFD